MSKQQQQKAMLRAMRRSNQSTPGAAPNTATGTIARTGIDKVLPEAPIAHGMKRVTTGDLHPYLHGQAINDEVDDKLHMTGKNVPLAYGTKATLAQFADNADLGSAILKQGALLSGK